MELRTQQITLNPNNKQATFMSQHAGYARVAYNFAVSSFKVSGREQDEWRSYIDIKREFNAVKRDLSESGVKPPNSFGGCNTALKH